MKSLRYILGGRPHTVDDCLDLARSRPPAKAVLDVKTDDLVTELRVLRQFVGTYRWEFPDRAICCKEVYGCVFLPATDQDRRSSVAAANARLRRRLAEIQRCRVGMVGANRRFEDSAWPPEST